MSSPRACPVVLPLLVALLLLSSSSAAWCMELSAAPAGGNNRPARQRLLVSRPWTSRQKAERQRMRVDDGAKKPFTQGAAASLGKRKVPRSGWNPIQNR